MAFRGTGGLEIRFEGDQARDITPFVHEFVWVQSMIEGGLCWRLKLSTDFWTEWNQLLLGRATPSFRLKFQSSGSGGDDTTDWYTAVVDTSRSTYRGTALTFMVEGADRRLALAQKDRTRAWPSSTVADVVRAIGSEYGFDVAAESAAYRTDRWQIREDDWSYMKQLADAAASASGRGDYYLWLNEDRLFLGAPQLQARSDRRHVMAEVENRIDRIVLAYHGRQVDRSGGATLVGVSFNTDTKQDVVFTLGASQAASHPALARRVPRAQADGLRVMPSLSEVREGVEETVRARWGTYAPRYFSLRLDSRPDLSLRPGMVMEMQGDLSPQQQTPLLGRFVVLEVQHRLTGGEPDNPSTGGLVTTAVCYRREAYEGEEAPTGSSVAAQGTRDRYRLGQPQLPRTTLVAEVVGD